MSSSRTAALHSGAFGRTFGMFGAGPLLRVWCSSNLILRSAGALSTSTALRPCSATQLFWPFGIALLLPAASFGIGRSRLTGFPTRGGVGSSKTMWSSSNLFSSS